jgi:hypothetical protein
MSINFDDSVFSSSEHLAAFLRDKPLIEELRDSAIKDNHTEETKNFRNAYRKWAITTAITFPFRFPTCLFFKSIHEIAGFCEIEDIARKSGDLAERVRMKSFGEDVQIYGLPGDLNEDYDSWLTGVNRGTYRLFKAKNAPNPEAAKCFTHTYEKKKFPENIQKIIFENINEIDFIPQNGICGGITYRFLYLYLSAASYDNPVNRIKKIARHFENGGDVQACILNDLRKTTDAAGEVIGIKYEKWNCYASDRDTLAAAKKNQTLTNEAYRLSFEIKISQNETEYHGVAYIRVSKNLGFLLDSNKGLIFCKSKDHFCYFVKLLEGKYNLNEKQKFYIIPCALKPDYHNDVIKGANHHVPIFSHTGFGLI